MIQPEGENAPAPIGRPRRLRLNAALRGMLRETRVSASDFIYPLFVVHGTGVRNEIGAMPGVFQLSIDQLEAEARSIAALGIPAVILFGIPAHKDPVGLENFADDGIVQQAIRALKAAVPELVVITDVCLCEYTDHGHCGILNIRSGKGGSETGGSETGGSETGGSETGGSETGGSETGGSETGGSETGGSETGGSETGGSETGGSETGGSETGESETGGSETRPYRNLPEGYLLNDETLAVLAKVVVSHARAGADIVAPSGMIDGAVAAIRAALDGAGFEHLAILSYAIKYASGFYGPFREAAQGAPKFGDRRTHQMDPANAREGLREAALDAAEGADLLMVKPALPYLDIIRQTREQIPQLPLVAYQVSGEYAMLKAAALNGWLEEPRTVIETLTAIKRAGADLIITYYAKEAVGWLAENGRWPA